MFNGLIRMILSFLLSLAFSGDATQYNQAAACRRTPYDIQVGPLVYSAPCAAVAFDGQGFFFRPSSLAGDVPVVGSPTDALVDVSAEGAPITGILALLWIEPGTTYKEPREWGSFKKTPGTPEDVARFLAGVCRRHRQIAVYCGTTDASGGVADNLTVWIMATTTPPTPYYSKDAPLYPPQVSLGDAESCIRRVLGKIPGLYKYDGLDAAFIRALSSTARRFEGGAPTARPSHEEVATAPVQLSGYAALHAEDAAKIAQTEDLIRKLEDEVRRLKETMSPERRGMKKR